jgi:hypothetical protein
MRPIASAYRKICIDIRCNSVEPVESGVGQGKHLVVSHQTTFLSFGCNPAISELKRATRVSNASLVRSPELQHEVFSECSWTRCVTTLSFSWIQKGATWSPGAERLKRYSADQIIGKHFSVFHPQTDVPAGKPAHELKVAAEVGHVAPAWRSDKWIRQQASASRQCR